MYVNMHMSVLNYHADSCYVFIHHDLARISSRDGKATTDHVRKITPLVKLRTKPKKLMTRIIYVPMRNDDTKSELLVGGRFLRC